MSLTTNFSIRVYFSARALIGAGWDKIRLHNEFWRLYCNRQAGVTLQAKATELAIRPGRLVLIPPRFAGVGRITGTVDHAYAHFDVLGFPPGLTPLLFPGPLEAPVTREIGPLLARWLRHVPPGGGVQSLAEFLRVEALVAEAVAACWDRAGGADQPAWKAWMERSPRLAQIEQWMEGRLDQDLSVPELARWTGYSPDHFRRVFLRVFGLNPAAYVTRLRVKEAARLLLFGHAAIEEIAARTGFVDRHHFSRVFRVITGETPARYRRRNLESCWT